MSRVAGYSKGEWKWYLEKEEEGDKDVREITNTIQVPGLIDFDDMGLFNTMDSFNIWTLYSRQEYLIIKTLKYYKTLNMNLISFYYSII